MGKKKAKYVQMNEEERERDSKGRKGEKRDITSWIKRANIKGRLRD